jgi:hypothetical protein
MKPAGRAKRIKFPGVANFTRALQVFGVTNPFDMISLTLKVLWLGFGKQRTCPSANT